MATGMKRLAGETAIYGISSIVGKFLNWMLVPMYTRVLANESDFGIVTNLYAWTALLMVILTYGMETGFFKPLSHQMCAISRTLSLIDTSKMKLKFYEYGHF